MFTRNLTDVLLDALAQYSASVGKVTPNRGALNSLLMDISDIDNSLRDADFFKPDNSKRILDIIDHKTSSSSATRRHIKEGIESIFSDESSFERLTAKLIERQGFWANPQKPMVRQGPKTKGGREFNVVRLADYPKFRSELAEKILGYMVNAFERAGMEPLEVDEVESVLDTVLEKRVQQNGQIYFDGMRRRLKTYFDNNKEDITGNVASHAIDAINDIARAKRESRANTPV